MLKKVLFVLMISLLVVGVGWANVDSKISFQGRLTEADSPITTSTDIYVNIYDGDADDAAASVIWTSPLTSVTPDDNGFFTMILEGNNLSDLSMDVEDDYSVEIVIDGVATLSPRQTLTAAPYAVALTSGSKVIEGGDEYALSVTNGDMYGTGIYGWGAVGIKGKSEWEPGYGVKGIASGGNGSVGIYGESDTGTAVYGVSPSGYAGRFDGDVLVYGLCTAESDDSHAFSGKVSGAYNAGVRGESTENVNGYGVYGKAPRPEDWMSTTWFWGMPQSWAGYFNGDVRIDGDLCVTGFITCEAVGRLIDRVDIELGISNKFNELDTEITELAVDIDELQAMDVPIKYFDWDHMDGQVNFPDPRVIQNGVFYLTQQVVDGATTYLPGVYYYDGIANEWVPYGTVDQSLVSGLGKLATQDTVDWDTDIANIPKTMQLNAIGAKRVGAQLINPDSVGVAADAIPVATDVNVDRMGVSLDKVAVFGITTGNETAGIYGNSNFGHGIYGESETGTGVYGESVNSYGIYGKSETGTAGYFDGKVRVTKKLSAGILEALYAVDGTFNAGLPLEGYNTAVLGMGEGTNSKGVFGRGYDGGVGVYGESGATGIAVYGKNDVAGANSFAGYFDGTVSVDGDLSYTGGLSQISSRKYKDNITLLSDDFFKVLQLQPKSFTYKASGKEDIGYIAEEVDDLGLTSLVAYKDGEPDGIDYTKISMYVLEVVKAQQAEISVLKQQNDEMVKRIRVLEEQN